MKIKKKHVDLSAVSHYLRHGQYPEGLSDSDKRCVRKRSKDFRLKAGVLYFVRDPKSDPSNSSGAESDSERPATEQVWREVLHKAEEIRKAFLECHVDNQGNHRTYDKTLKEFSDRYYLAKTIETVRNYIKECPVCQAYRSGYSATATPASKTPSEREEHVAELMAALPFPETLGEVINHFWQKVEVDILGPIKVTGGSAVQVILCLDVYSLWPEARFVEYKDGIIPITEMLQFILSLIARYGVMKTLTFRKESFSCRKIAGRFDLLTDKEHAIDLKFGCCQDTNGMWKDLEADLRKFAKSYPRNWHESLDLWLMPHRINRPQIAEYTPVYLVHHREPCLPLSISFRQPGSDLDPNLSDSQIQSIQTKMMKVSKGLTESLLANTSEQPSSSEKNLPVLYYYPGEEVVDENSSQAPVAATEVNGEVNPNELHSENIVDTPAESSTTTTTTATTTTTTTTTTTNNNNNVTNKTSSTPASSTPVSVKSKKLLSATNDKPVKPRGRPPSSQSTQTSIEDDTSNVPIDEDECLSGSEMSPGRRGRKKNYLDVVNRYSPKKGNKRKKRENRDVPLDDYYLALKLYIEQKRYPPGIKDDYKRVIRKMAQNYVIQDDEMYYKSGSKLKKIVMDELERFKLLKAAHVLENGTHLGRLRTLDRLNDYYWKGMTMDGAALVKTCPVCEHGSERRKSEADTNPAQESFLNLVKAADAEPEPLNEEVQIRLYEIIKQFHLTGAKPADITTEENDYADRESPKYRVNGGQLYYTENQTIGRLRKVLMTAAEKQNAVTESHILRTGIHRGVERTKELLHGSYYWIGMNRDLKEFLDKCCLTRVFPEDKKLKSQEEKLSKFAEFFQMDISPFISLEQTVELKGEKEEDATVLTSVGLKVKSPSPPPTEELETKTLTSQEESNIEDVFLNAVQVVEPDSITAQPEETTLAESNAILSQEITDSSKTIEVLSPSVKTYNEVACNTEDSDNLDEVDDVELDQPKAIVKKMNIETIKNQTSRRQQKSVTVHVPEKTVEDHLSEEVQNAVDNIKPDVSDIHIADDVSALTSMIQRRQNAAESKIQETIVSTVESDVEMTKAEEIVKEIELAEAEEFEESVDGNQTENTSMVDSKAFLTKKTKGKRMKRKKQLACNICGLMFGGPVTLQVHMSTHSGQKPFGCDVCGKRFTERKYVRIHMRRHTGEKPYLCSVCGKGFPRTQSLLAHMSVHEKDKDHMQKCEICNRPFASDNRLNAHMEAKHPAVPKVYKCAECSRVFTAMRSLKRHIEAHMGLKRYECQHCGRRFLRKEYLRSHAAQHTGEIYPAPKRKKPDLPCPQLKITVGSNTYSVFTSDATAAVTPDQQETWVAAELVQNEEQIQDPTETARATESVEQSVEAPLFFIAPNQVEYEVECTSSGGTELTEADLTAINILAQATLNAPNTLPLT
ncbi:uncharacterized protein LOC106874323 [Octopus bimaculoides]|uniref:C2H2-type domain-containing protein n=1 Tax=Octopus bimaculoides TaxID=37653 RepID=A0A0L8GWD6_OCTBM|nr:uncharacterized protein LOC106874323 [Octopus bimaculoides]|eukprot:XP_014777496.1 PREDICTED: uncharacterized protein LOC106874323 [Octopus bimaculoides]